MKKLGILGCGKMGSAILKGATKQLLSPAEVLICESSTEHAKQLQAMGYEVTDNAARLATECQTVLLSVKPQDMKTALSAVQKASDALFISIAAGLSLADLQAMLGEVAIVRAMPNTAATIGLAATCISPSARCTAQQVQTAKALFASVGTVVEIPESLMDAVIPLSGSFIAYAYYFAKGFAEQAQRDGVPADAAISLLGQTLIGAGTMLLQGDKPIDNLIKDVCSKGGTTIAGLECLEQGNLPELCADCSRACSQRSRELRKS